MLELSTTFLYIIGFIVYFRSCLKNTKPNLVSWLSWSLISLIGFIVYFTLNKTWTFSLILLIDAIACLIIVIVFRKTGLWYNISYLQKSIILISISAFSISLIPSLNSSISITLLCLSSVSFIPTIISSYKGIGNEPSIPWFIWSCTILINIIALESYTFNTLAMPLTSFIFHIICLITTLKYISYSKTLIPS